MPRIAYFKNGTLFDVSPRDKAVPLYDARQTAYDAEIIVSDGITYRMPEDIDKIPIPKFEEGEDHEQMGVTGNLSYILKMKLGSLIDASILPAYIEKVLLMMSESGISWTRRDYLQVIRSYYRAGLFKVGDEYERQFRYLNPWLFADPNQNSFEVEHSFEKQRIKERIEKKRK